MSSCSAGIQSQLKNIFQKIVIHPLVKLAHFSEVAIERYHWYTKNQIKLATFISGNIHVAIEECLLLTVESLSASIPLALVVKWVMSLLADCTLCNKGEMTTFQVP